MCLFHSSCFHAVSNLFRYYFKFQWPYRSLGSNPNMDGQTINTKSGAENYRIVNIPDHPFLQSKLEFDIKRLPSIHEPSRGISRNQNMDGQTINKKSVAKNYKIVNIPDHPFLQSKLEYDIKRLPLRHKPSRGIERNRNVQTRYRRDQNSVAGKYEIFNNLPAHSAPTAPKSQTRHYSFWTWTNRLNYWCTNYKHKINWNPDGIIYYFWHVLLYFILLA